MEIFHPAAAALFVNFLPWGKQIAATNTSLPLSSQGIQALLPAESTLQPLQKGSSREHSAHAPPGPQSRASAMAVCTRRTLLQTSPRFPWAFPGISSQDKRKTKPPPLHQAHKLGLSKICFCKHITIDFFISIWIAFFFFLFWGQL